ncbi:MAG: T9SS type A sorting domain-containing protein [Janthinobacterium lividum]
MKIFTRLFATATVLLTTSTLVGSAQTLYDNFETTRIVNYPYSSGVLTQNAANPGSNTANSSTTCARYVRDAGSAYDVIVIKPTAAPGTMANVSAYSAGTKRISIKFRSPAAGLQVQAVLQNSTRSNTNIYPNGKYAGDFNATTTVANAWETLTFTFTAASAGNFDPTLGPNDVDQMVLLITPGTANGNTYYLDDIMGPELATTTSPVVVVTDQLYDNYEGTRAIKYAYAKTSGTIKLDTLNPAVSIANPSAHVMRYTRSTAQYDVLVVRPTNVPLADVSPFVTGAKQMTMKVYSPAPGIAFQITLQDSTTAGASNYPTGRHSEYLATTTATKAWETLVFTFSNRPSAAVANTSVNEIVLLIASNTTVARKVYIDDWTGPHKTNFLATRATQDAVLSAVYPNPTSGTAYLPVQLLKSAAISISVYDALGRCVATPLASQTHAAGTFTAEVPTTGLAAGFYTLRLSVDGSILTRPLSVQ